ncbi:hypothetical protein EJB05_17346, partial [Eragrostis curvula]
MACDCKLLSAYLLLLLAHAAAASGAGVKIVVYWGLDRNEGSLAKTCATGHYAIVVMAFLWVFDAGQTPVLNLANHCNPSGNGCTGLASEIASCQSSGIKMNSKYRRVVSLFHKHLIVIVSISSESTNRLANSRGVSTTNRSSNRLANPIAKEEHPNLYYSWHLKPIWSMHNPFHILPVVQEILRQDGVAKRIKKCTQN